VTKTIRVLMLAVTLLGVTALATAQNNLHVDVPFDFQIDGRTLPAGTYTIARVYDRDPNFFAVTGVQSSARAVVHASGSSRDAGAGLSFLHNGESYLLTTISTPAGKFDVAQKRSVRITPVSQTIDVSAGGR